MDRKQAKKDGKRVFRWHYLFYVAFCLVLSFLGVIDSSSLNTVRSQVAKMTDKTHVEEDISYIQTSPLGVNTSDIVYTLLEKGDAKAASEVADSLAKGRASEAAVHNNPAIQFSRGIFANIATAISSGGVVIYIVSAISNLTGSTSVALYIFMLLSLLVTFAVFIFIKQTLGVSAARIFLESRIYSKPHPQRIFFLHRVRKWFKVSITLLVKEIWELLWSLTIVGGIIKHYSYYMVPYILAENPNLTAKESVTLSRRMMNGYKWKVFVFDLSFIGWYILSNLTFGLVGIFFSVPYKEAAAAELYVQLRKTYIDKGEEDTSRYFIDRLLYELPTDEELKEGYENVINDTKEAFGEPIILTGIQGFFQRNFGIALLGTVKAEKFERQQLEQSRLKKYNAVLNREAYPGRLYLQPEAKKRSVFESIDFMRSYTPTRIVLLFIIYCLIGWIWEVSQHLIKDGIFVNRGMLHGPWIPIYGTGGIIMLILLYRVRKNPLVFFISGVILCGVLEYFTCYITELTHNGKRWWDYSGYFLNLHGRICAEGLLAFGVLGLVCIYILTPIIDNALRRIPRGPSRIAAIILMVLFFSDVVYSKFHPNEGKGITTPLDSEDAYCSDNVVTECIENIDLTYYNI